MFKHLLFKTLAFIFLLLPLGILVYIRREIYFTTKDEALKLSFGFVFALIMGLLLLSNKTKNINGIIWCGILALLSYLLSSIMIDIMFVFICMGCGLTLYKIFNSISEYFKEIYKVKRNTKIQYKAKIELDKEYGNV
jgi:hypothetical protein